MTHAKAQLAALLLSAGALLLTGCSKENTINVNNTKPEGSSGAGSDTSSDGSAGTDSASGTGGKAPADGSDGTSAAGGSGGEGTEPEAGQSGAGADSGSDCVGGVEDGHVQCSGPTLVWCNGGDFEEIQTCSSNDACAHGVPEDNLYDSASPPSCCTKSEYYCEGSVLFLCDDDGSGPVDDAGKDCQTPALCEAGRDAETGECPTPACDAEEYRCAGGTNEVMIEQCKEDRTDWDIHTYCDDLETNTVQQCNPATGSCFTLGMDPFEVTRADYQAFLNGDPAPSVADQEPGCEWNDSFEPDPTCLAGASPGDEPCTGEEEVCSHPQVCIDWCDAYAYCQAQGKRLCGRIGGGPIKFDGDEHDDPGTDQWMNGCSAGGAFVYGFGIRTNSDDKVGVAGTEDCTSVGVLETTYAVGTRNNCHSPAMGYSDLYDLSGNVAEWVDSCELEVVNSVANGDNRCWTRGGSYESDRDRILCAALPRDSLQRDATLPTVGFRCCAAD